MARKNHKTTSSSHEGFSFGSGDREYPIPIPAVEIWVRYSPCFTRLCSVFTILTYLSTLPLVSILRSSTSSHSAICLLLWETLAFRALGLLSFRSHEDMWGFISILGLSEVLFLWIGERGQVVLFAEEMFVEGMFVISVYWEPSRTS